MKSANLISIPQLADDGCVTVLDKEKIIVKKDEKIVLSGKRNMRDGLYDVVIKKHPNPKTSITPCNYVMPTIHNIYECKASPTTSMAAKTKASPQRKITRPYHIDNIKSQQLSHLIALQKQQDTQKESHINVILQKQLKSKELAQFLHGCCGSPVISTFIQAIKNNHFLSWPGLTANLIKKHLTTRIATMKGHMRREAQHLQSTKKTSTTEYIDNIKRNIKRLKSKMSDKMDLKDV